MQRFAGVRHRRRGDHRRNYVHRQKSDHNGGVHVQSIGVSVDEGNEVHIEGNVPQEEDENDAGEEGRVGDLN